MSNINTKLILDLVNILSLKVLPLQGEYNGAILSNSLYIAYSKGYEILTFGDIEVDNLRLSTTEIKKFPNIKTVTGNLELFNCINLELLPDGLSCESLDLCNCKRLKSLPKELFVAGDVDLSYCINLKSLPDDLIALGDINIYESGIPEDVKPPKGLQGKIISDLRI